MLVLPLVGFIYFLYFGVLDDEEEDEGKTEIYIHIYPAL